LAKAGYKTSTEGAVALSAAATKTVLGVLAPAQFGCDWIKARVSMDQTTAMLGVDIEFCSCTFATNPPATNSTTVAVTQVYGRAITAGFTAAKNWTAEPTVVAVIDEFFLDPNKGTVLYDASLGQSADNDVSRGFCIRCVTQASSTPNVRAGMWIERC
jgi:hypothetical protein